MCQWRDPVILVLSRKLAKQGMPEIYVTTVGSMNYIWITFEIVIIVNYIRNHNKRFKAAYYMLWLEKGILVIIYFPKLD